MSTWAIDSQLGSPFPHPTEPDKSFQETWLGMVPLSIRVAESHCHSTPPATLLATSPLISARTLGVMSVNLGRVKIQVDHGPSRPGRASLSFWEVF